MINLKTLLLGGLSLGLVAAKAIPQSSYSYGSEFDPYQYKKTFVQCPAVDSSNLPGSTPMDLRLGYLDLGNPASKKVLILVHGWPSLWTTYRGQINYFTQKGYRLIIPEHRGYGDSQHPQNLNGSNTFINFVSDMQCMMDNAKVHSGVCVGNDFGAQVCWEAGRARPDRFIGVFNVGIPYLSAKSGYLPNTVLAGMNPSFSYQVFLGNHPDIAAKEMDADIRMSIRSCAQKANSSVPPTFLQSTTSFLGPWKTFLQQRQLDQIPASGIMNKAVEDYMVEAYRKQGFYSTFNGYQSQNRNLTIVYDMKQGNYTLSQPTFSLYPTKDPVADWAAVAKEVGAMAFLPNFKSASMPTAHWPHEELPDQFNEILNSWLGSSITFPK